MYPGSLLEGVSTKGVSGKLAPWEAFAKLLEGTPLMLSEADGSLLITQASADSQRDVASRTLPQAGVQMTRDKISADSPGSAADVRVCHRVSEGIKAHIYCGSADQWSDLKTTVGFRCRREGKRDELCASTREWTRLRVKSTQMASPYVPDEATQSVMQNHPMPTFSATVSAPPTPIPTPGK
jgi:hypothetical protein